VARDLRKKGGTVKITNTSLYLTRNLRRIVARVAAEELTSEQRAGIISVRFETRRGSRKGPCTSVAVGRTDNKTARCAVSLPEQSTEPEYVAVALARAFAEAKGVSQRQMQEVKRYGFKTGWHTFYSSVVDIPITKRAPRIKARPTSFAKLVHGKQNAEARVREWERKQKLATTKLKVWRAKVRYYDRKLEKRRPKEEAGATA